MYMRTVAIGLAALSLAALGLGREAVAQVAAVDVNGVTLSYQVEGSGEPLVLIHGWALSRREWDGQVEALAEHYTVIRYDRRGFGESTGTPDLTADPADLKALLEALGHSRAHLLGHSQGAYVALTAAVRYPEMVSTLILFGQGELEGFGLPWDGPDAFPLEEWSELAIAHGVDSLKAIIAAMAETHMFPDRPDLAERTVRELASYRGLDLIAPETPSGLVEPAQVTELRAVLAPTLVLIGDREMPYAKILADALAYGITGAKKVVVPDGGHALNWEHPDRFVDEVLGFLAKSDGSEPAGG